MLVSLVVKLEYYILFVHFLISIIIGLIIIVLSYLLITQQPDVQKLSTYECGFDPFGDARNSFNIHFYLVGILFIIFDLEISFLFPWIITLSSLNIYGVYSMFIFIFILTVGFLYEWVKGALEWE